MIVLFRTVLVSTLFGVCSVHDTVYGLHRLHTIFVSSMPWLPCCGLHTVSSMPWISYYKPDSFAHHCKIQCLTSANTSTLVDSRRALELYVRTSFRATFPATVSGTHFELYFEHKVRISIPNSPYSMTDSLSIFELHSELQFEPYFYLEL